MIFFKRDFEDKINFSVFPQHQGGPHMNNVAALCVALKDATSERYVEYAKQVVSNAQTMATAMIDKGYEIMTGGTENHLILWNVKPLGLTGVKVETVLEKINIYCNKNSIAGDKSPISPGGVRFGTPAMTTRGMVEEDMKTIIESVAKAVDIATKVQEKSGKKLKDFNEALDSEEFAEEIAKAKEEVAEFCRKFPVPKSHIE